MNDLLLALAWSGFVVTGLGAAVFLRRLGMAGTHVRDLVHVGGGAWVLGWPWWRSPVLPVTITLAAAALMAAIPLAAPRLGVARRLRGALAGGEERWGGIVLYTLAFAGFTAIGLAADVPSRLPAAAALLALALGDGIGGAIGLRFGARFYAVPGGKRKSLEGSVAVAAFATLGILGASAWFGGHLTFSAALLAGLTAAVAEALAPRGTDNIIVPVAAFVVLRFLLGGQGT